MDEWLKSTGKRCVTNCGGTVVARTYRVQVGEPVYGPGNRTRLETSYYCDACGLLYRFPPGENPEKKS